MLINVTIDTFHCKPECTMSSLNPRQLGEGQNKPPPCFQNWPGNCWRWATGLGTSESCSIHHLLRPRAILGQVRPRSYDALLEVMFGAPAVICDVSCQHAILSSQITQIILGSSYARPMNVIWVRFGFGDPRQSRTRSLEVTSFFAQGLL